MTDWMWSSKYIPVSNSKLEMPLLWKERTGLNLWERTSTAVCNQLTKEDELANNLLQSHRVHLLRANQSLRTGCSWTSPEDSFISLHMWDVGQPICPSGVRRFDDAGHVVAPPCEHTIELQRLSSKINCLFNHVSVRHALQSWIVRIGTVLKTVEQRRLLHCKHFRFPSTLLNLLLASVKTPPRKSKLYG